MTFTLPSLSRTASRTALAINSLQSTLKIHSPMHVVHSVVYEQAIPLPPLTHTLSPLAGYRPLSFFLVICLPLDAVMTTSVTLSLAHDVRHSLLRLRQISVTLTVLRDVVTALMRLSHRQIASDLEVTPNSYCYTQPPPPSSQQGGHVRQTAVRPDRGVGQTADCSDRRGVVTSPIDNTTHHPLHLKVERLIAR